ncbi:MAG: restriction endonuclease [Nanoarchaeota archaeon]|nr:restriction endonuclease [Nanoarchaeota archaeon]
MRITNENELEEFLKKTGWQSFEKLVANIFEEHGYSTKINTVLKNTQIDVIAKKYGKKIVIECKKWKTNNSTKIKKETTKQKRRVELINADEAIIVTLKEFKEKEINKVKIVPLNKLNNYLNLE